MEKNFRQKAEPYKRKDLGRLKGAFHLQNDTQRQGVITVHKYLKDGKTKGGDYFAYF